MQQTDQGISITKKTNRMEEAEIQKKEMTKT